MKLIAIVLGSLFLVMGILYYVGTVVTSGPSPADTRAKIYNKIQVGMSWREAAVAMPPKRVVRFSSKKKSGKLPPMDYEKFIERMTAGKVNEGFEYSYNLNAYHVVAIFNGNGECVGVQDLKTQKDLLDGK